MIMNDQIRDQLIALQLNEFGDADDPTVVALRSVPNGTDLATADVRTDLGDVDDLTDVERVVEALTYFYGDFAPQSDWTELPT